MVTQLLWLNRKPTLPSRKWCDKKGQTQKSNCHLAGLFLCLKMGLNRDSMPRALSLHDRTISDYQVSQVKSLLRAPHQIKQLTFSLFFIFQRHHFFTKSTLQAMHNILFSLKESSSFDNCVSLQIYALWIFALVNILR